MAKGENTMRRILAVCLNQTLHFQLKDDMEHGEAAAAAAAEVAEYKEYLQKKRIPHRILEEVKQPDDSIILKVKKQVNSYSVGDYLD